MADWEAKGDVYCQRHRSKLAMDWEGVVRHLVTGTLCDIVPNPSPDRQLASAAALAQRPEPTNQESRPDILLTMTDAAGRDWIAAGFLGELMRYEEGNPHSVEQRSIHDFSKERMHIKELKVIIRECD